MLGNMKVTGHVLLSPEILFPYILNCNSLKGRALSHLPFIPRFCTGASM